MCYALSGRFFPKQPQPVCASRVYERLFLSNIYLQVRTIVYGLYFVSLIEMLLEH